MSKFFTSLQASLFYRRFFQVADYTIKAGWTVLGLAIATYVVHAGTTYSDPFNGPGLTIPLMTVISGIVIAITGMSISTRVGLAEVLGIERPVARVS
jgi:hypothetical protein